MHELPKDLTSSLRSYRGSIYGGNGRGAGAEEDLEKGPAIEEYGDSERYVNPTDSSLVIHPTKSTQALDRAREEQAGNNDGSQRQNPILRFENTRNSLQRPRVNTDVRTVKPQSAGTAQTPAKQSIFHEPPVKDTDPAADRLADDIEPLTSSDFHELMGMRPSPTRLESAKQIAIRHGLFSRMLSSLESTQRKYRVFAVAVYVLLLLQLMISAIFIVLGALQHVDTHITIATLGAVSTLIAGGLALMQGQGLPNRLRMSRDNLRSVVFEAEELYWDMRSGRPVLYKDVKKVREDYLRVLEEMKRNHPDAWNSVGQSGARPGGGGGAAVTGVSKVR